MSKICNNCKRSVEDNAKYCPYCKGTSFGNVIAKEPNKDLIHRIFYWSYPEGSVLSKSKLAAILVFLYLALAWIFSGFITVSVFLAAGFAFITFLIGYAVHMIRGKTKVEKITNNDYGLITDLKYLFFYWQDRNGGYVISKTKVISFIIFLIMFCVGLLTLNVNIVFGAIFFALLFEIPAFAIGFAIHKLTFKDDGRHEIPTREVKQKKVKTTSKIPLDKPKVIPEYLDYQIQLDELNSKFIIKEKSARNLIEKRFEPPQITYTRFITGVDKSSQLFKKNLESAHTMINLADEYSQRIASEIELKIEILKEIIEKLDGLSNELIVKEDISTKEDVDGLMGEMDDLIGSVKDYDSK